jgi:integrase
MSPRRGFGSVRRLPSRRFQECYWNMGFRHTAPNTFATPSEAKVWLTTEQAKVLNGHWTDPAAGRLLFGNLARQWLQANPAKRESTIARDEIAIRLHILPMLGKRRADAITPAEVQGLVNQWCGTQAPATVRRSFDVFRAIFNHAVRTDVLVRSPCRGIYLPEDPITRRRSLTPDDISRLADAIADRYQLTVWLGAVLGLRWGEVAGLRVSSIDVLGQSVSVVEQITRGSGGRSVVGQPKSRAGTRTLSIPIALAELVAEHMKREGLTAANGDAFIFTNGSGTPLNYSNFRRRIWLPAVSRAGLSGIGFHDLRRAAATALVTERVDIKTVQTRLGHSDPRLTLAIYAQATTDSDHAAAKRLGKKFFAPKRSA